MNNAYGTSWLALSIMTGAFSTILALAFIGKLHPELKKSWKFELALQLTFLAMMPLNVAAAIYVLFNSLVLSFFSYIVFIVFIMARRLIYRFLQHKPPASKYYRWPLVKYEGVVSEKNLHPKKVFRREWIIFSTTNGQQIKAYIPMPSMTHGRTGPVPIPNVGDAGTFLCRKHKEFYYFDEFLPRPEDLDAILGAD